MPLSIFYPKSNDLTQSWQNQKVVSVILRANRSIGTGHLMRVRTLVEKLQSHALLHLYVYAFDVGLKNLCSEYDMVSVFNTKEDILEHLIKLRTIEQRDSHETLTLEQRLKDYLATTFIIDDYAIDQSFEKPLYQKARIFVIDDLYDRDHCCDQLLNQNLIFFEDYYKAHCNADCQLLMGSKYSLTAEKFYPKNRQNDYHSYCNCGAHSLEYNYRVNLHSTSVQVNQLKHQKLIKVLISFGGADPVSACLTLTKTILEHKLYTKYIFTMLCGAANQDYETIVSLVKANVPEDKQTNFKVIKHCNDVADLLYRHDVTIGAYGGMTRERIASGIPTIGVVIADNQIGGDELFRRFEIGLDLKLEQLQDGDKVEQTLQELIAKAQIFTNNSLKIYDGLGLQRILDKVLELNANPRI